MGAPIGNTCPDIDKVIDAITNSQKSVQAALDNLTDLLTHTEDMTERQIEWAQNAEDEIRDVDSELWRLEDVLEELRHANSALRDWGEGKEAEIEELENTLDKLREIL
jgi:predicted RNase H-like nuclease (RuvC/YqgF family)